MITGSLRNVFYITKGQYRKVGETVNSGDSTLFLGGFNPYADDTEEWYGLYDNVAHQCHCCGPTLTHVLNAIPSLVRKCRSIEKVINSDNVVSKHAYALQAGIFNLWGDFSRTEIEAKVEEGYALAKDDTPLKRAKRLVKARRLTPRQA